MKPIAPIALAAAAADCTETPMSGQQLRQAGKRRKPFRLILTGTALQPRFCNGDRLTIDPAREAAPGEAVVAQLDEAHGGGTACMLLNADGDLYDHRGAFIPRGEYLVIGVVARGYPARVGE